MCTLSELENGTYSIIDVLIMHELLDLKQALQPPPPKKKGM